MPETQTVLNKTLNLIPENTRHAAIELLQARLYDAVDLTAQAKQAHWNVKGVSFVALHALFENIHSEMVKYTDLLAKRLVALGGQAYVTVRSSAENSTLEEYPLAISRQADHIEELSFRLVIFCAEIRAAIAEAVEIGDRATAHLFVELSMVLDKSIWRVEAHR